jgi:hypothetical protein
MPRIKEETATLRSDLTSRLERLVAVARNEGRDAALAEVRSLVGGGLLDVVRRGPGRPKGGKNKPKTEGASATPRKKRKNSWAGLSAEARLARVNSIRKGKGLPPKESL